VIDITSITFPRFAILFFVTPRHHPSCTTLDLLRTAVVFRIFLFVVPGHYLFTVGSILLEGYIEPWRRTELALIFLLFLPAQM
jgi:hypothetical protein